jgi:toxin ParE1/3/4
MAVEYISKNRPEVAKKVAGKIKNSIHLLADQPDLGRPGKVEGTRELILPNLPYLIVYTEMNEEIIILRILHSSMNWPESIRI